MRWSRNRSAIWAERFQTSSLLCTYKLCDYYSPIPILSPFLFTPSLYAPILNLQDCSFTCIQSTTVLCDTPLHSTLRFMDLLVTTVAFPPTNLTYEVQSDFTSILLMWVPPSPLGDTTGYRISYNAAGGSSNSVDISDGTTSKYTLSDLEKGKDYNISIVGTSDHFFSMSVAWNLITLKG